MSLSEEKKAELRLDALSMMGRRSFPNPDAIIAVLDENERLREALRDAAFNVKFAGDRLEAAGLVCNALERARAILDLALSRLPSERKGEG